MFILCYFAQPEAPIYFVKLIENSFKLVSFIVSDEDNEVDEDEKRLLNKLFSRYDPEIRPVFKKRDTVRVKFGVSLFQIIDVVRNLSEYFTLPFVHTKSSQPTTLTQLRTAYIDLVDKTNANFK